MSWQPGPLPNFLVDSECDLHLVFDFDLLSQILLCLTNRSVKRLSPLPVSRVCTSPFLQLKWKDNTSQLIKLH